MLTVGGVLSLLFVAAWLWQTLDKRRRWEAIANLARDSRVHPAPSVELLGSMPDILRESSGIAASRSHRGILWSHNDSGDDPVLYAIDATGRLIARFEVRGARARDWEDMAQGPCPFAADGDSTACLYIGDIGDNRRRRGAYSIWIVPEPDPWATPGRSTEPSWHVVYRYADRRRDAEALAVTPDGDVLIVNKGRTGRIDVFVIDSREVRDAIRSADTLLLRATDTLPIQPDRRIGRVVTGAAISPSGQRMVVRTYHELYVFRRASDGTWTPPPASCFLGPLEHLGEAVDFLDEHTMVLTSETGGGMSGDIHRVRCD